MRLNRNQRYRRPAAKPFVESSDERAGRKCSGAAVRRGNLPPGALSVEEINNYGEN
jgi:hypothetical protein